MNAFHELSENMPPPSLAANMSSKASSRRGLGLGGVQKGLGGVQKGLGGMQKGVQKGLGGIPKTSKTNAHNGVQRGTAPRRRVLEDITNQFSTTVPGQQGLSQKQSKSRRPIPRDAEGRVLEPECMPSLFRDDHDTFDFAPPPKIDLFADDEYGPAMPKPKSPQHTEDVYDFTKDFERLEEPPMPSTKVDWETAAREDDILADVLDGLSRFDMDDLLPDEDFAPLTLA